MDEDNIDSCILDLSVLDLAIQSGNIKPLIGFYNTCKKYRNFINRYDKLEELSLALRLNDNKIGNFKEIIDAYIISKIEISRTDKAFKLAIKYFSTKTLHTALLNILNSAESEYYIAEYYINNTLVIEYNDYIVNKILNGLLYSIEINKEYLIEKILEILMKLLIEKKLIEFTYENSITYSVDINVLENILFSDTLPFDITIKMFTWLDNIYPDMYKYILKNIIYNPTDRKRKIQNYYGLYMFGFSM